MGDNLEQLITTLEGISAKDIRPSLSDDELSELDSCYVQSNTRTPLTLETQDSWSFDKLIDQCREYIIEELPKIFVLSDRYRVGKDSSIGSSTYSDSTNGVTTLLKGRIWRKVHSLVGNDIMCQLFLNYDGFYVSCKGVHQIFGKKLNNRNYTKRNLSNEVNLNSSLYVNIGDIYKMNPIPLSKKEFFQSALKEEFENNGNYRKLKSKHKSFCSIISKIQRNQMGTPYFGILSSICESRENQPGDASQAVSKADVFKFCSIVFEKVFPLETYGSKHNKSVILRNLGMLIMGKMGDSMKDHHLMKDISLKNICWLGKSHLTKLNKQDFHKRYKLFNSFQLWLFNHFFNRLLGSFFHITHISSSKELIYFNHLTWNKITKPFVLQYRAEKLTKVPDAEMMNDNGIYTKLRVLPKKNDTFRAINSPLKGNYAQSRDNYEAFVQKKIKPTRHILSHLRMVKGSKYPKLRSPRDIPLFLKNYKEKVMTGDVFYLKFDVKDCYDTLPRDQIMKLTRALVDSNERYFVNYHDEYGISFKARRMKTHCTIDTITSQVDNDNHNTRAVRTGGGVTFSLNGEEILSIVHNQLESSYSFIGKEVFNRQEGVFQGLHLSSVFCDIVYDEMIDCEFHELDSSNSLILRIADDFLVLSTRKQSLLKIYSKLNKGFPLFGAEINQGKTLTNINNNHDHKFSFCGFTIDIDSFQITKTFEDLHMLNTKSHSFLTQKLLWIFKSRLSNNTFNLDVNSRFTVLHQIYELAHTSAKTYIQGVALLPVPEIITFNNFLEQLTEETFNSVCCNSKSGIDVSDIRLVICNAFLMYFTERNTRFKEHIKHLQKCVYMNLK